VVEGRRSPYALYQHALATYEAGVAKGLGAVALDGEMLDPPIVERARRVLRSAGS